MSLNGSLRQYKVYPDEGSGGKEYSLPVLISGDPDASRAIIFIGGLYDGMGSVPYADQLGDMAYEFDWMLAQPHWSSAHHGFATGSLKRDALELEGCVKTLRRQGVSTVVLMGHSTGCQDLMTYLLERHSKTPVSGAILQAPVSDREAFVSVAHAAIRREAEEMVRNGRGDETMDVKLARAAFDLDHLTAYRAWSLLCKGGDDDFFSTDLPLNKDDSGHRPLSDTFGKLPEEVPVLCLFSEKDEYTPASVDKHALFEEWCKAAKGENLECAIVEDATHKVEGPDEQNEMLTVVAEFLSQIEDED